MHKEVTIRIGKKGITISLHDEIKKNIQKNDYVKLKFLKNILDYEDKDELTDSLKNVLPEGVDISKKIGNTIILKKQG